MATFYYTNVDRVNALLPGDKTITIESDPDLSEVERWIENVEGKLNVALVDGGHTSPATDAKQLAAFDLLCARDVAWQAMMVNGGVDAKHPYHTDFEAALGMIADGGMPSAADEAGSPWAHTMDADTSSDSSKRARVEKGMEF